MMEADAATSAIPKIHFMAVFISSYVMTGVTAIL